MFNLISFDRPMPSSNYQNQGVEHFHHPKTFPHVPLHLYIYPCLQATTDLPSVIADLPLLKSHK